MKTDQKVCETQKSEPLIRAYKFATLMYGVKRIPW